MTVHALLAIKTLRMERQRQRLHQQQLKVDALSRTCQQAEEKYSAFHQWRIAEENRLFALCMATVINDKALTLWQQQVSTLRKQEEKIAATLAEHQAQLALARKQHQADLQQYQSIWHQTQKYQEVSARALAEEKQQQELKEEQEMEECRRGEIIFLL